MKKVEGVHGTTESRAKAIKKEGFKISTKGRAGKGIYFWTGYKARDLGICWHRQCLANKRYEGDQSKRCALIWVILNIEPENFLDLENNQIRERLHELIDKRGINDPKKLPSLYDWFIKIMEAHIRYKIKVFQVRLAPPSNCPEYDIKIYGAPDCLVVRDASCIKINKCEVI